MSIFERISLLFRSNVNAVVSKAEDPEKVLNQLIEDMKKEFAEAKKLAAVAIAEERKLFRQMDKAQAEARTWEQKAVQALHGGREDLAKAAMQKKVAAEGSVTELQPLWNQQKSAADQLRDALVKLNERIDEANRKKNILIARAKRAEAQKQIQTAMGSIGTSSAFSHFERMETKVERLEAEADASELLGSMDQNLDQEFKQLEAQSEDTEADLALLELKSKMGLITGNEQVPLLESSDTNE
jgi:phage shock protein A